MVGVGDLWLNRDSWFRWGRWLPVFRLRLVVGLHWVPEVDDMGLTDSRRACE